MSNKKSKGNNKHYGLQKERQLKKLLYDEGALEVVRARGSFGMYDIIAFFEDHVKLISCKATKQKYASYKQEIIKITDHDLPMFIYKKQLRIYWSPRKDRKQKGWQIIKID